MLDPLFSLAFLGAVTLPVAAIVFFIAKRRLANPAATWMAVAVPLAGLLGFFGCTALLVNFLPMFWMEAPSDARLAMSFGAALLSAGLTGWTIYRRAR